MIRAARILRLDLYLDLTLRYGGDVNAIAAHRPELESAGAELADFLKRAGVDFGKNVRRERPLPNVRLVPSATRPPPNPSAARYQAP